MVRMTHALAAMALAMPAFALMSSPGPACAKTLHLAISDMAFETAPMAVHVGDVIEWSNHDFVAHTVTANDGSFDVTIPPGKAGQIVLRHAGETPFYCRFHPNMKGTLDVVR